MLSCAAWGKTSLMCMNWAKKDNKMEILNKGYASSSLSTSVWATIGQKTTRMFLVLWLYESVLVQGLRLVPKVSLVQPSIQYSLFCSLWSSLISSDFSRVEWKNDEASFKLLFWSSELRLKNGKKFPKFSELMVYSTHLRPNKLFSIRGSKKRACIEFRIKLVSPKAA